MYKIFTKDGDENFELYFGGARGFVKKEDLPTEVQYQKFYPNSRWAAKYKIDERADLKKVLEETFGTPKLVNRTQIIVMQGYLNEFYSEKKRKASLNDKNSSSKLDEEILAEYLNKIITKDSEEISK